MNTFGFTITPSHIDKTFGKDIFVQTKHEKHFVDFNQIHGSSPNITTSDSGNTENSFYQNMVNTFESLNNQIVKSDRLTEKFIVEPDKVNVHDVMIGLQKSRFSLDLTRSVIQRSIDGYKTIINLR